VVTIILLAMVAGFVALRLYSVLGKRTGHEQTVAKPIDAPTRAMPSVRTLPGPAGDIIEAPDAAFADEAALGIKQIAAIDGSFNAAQFIAGARSAYGLILEAFWRGDEAELRRFADEDVVAAFGEAIADRKAKGHVLDNRLISIERAQIERAILDGQLAHITLRFKADIAAVTRNADGEVVAGSMSDAVTTDDLWTFSRNVRSNDPNWMLTETDEAA
jgi:predicted lipid-binding transport protein (Tim44 family)